MGYFKRTIRRSRCAAEVRAALEGNPAPEICRWELVPPDPLPPALKEGSFFRLATTEIDVDSHQLTGIFSAAYALRNALRLSSGDRHHLNRLLKWFGLNLTAPRDVTPAAIFWFRSDARECGAAIWEMVHLLRAYGVPVQMMRTRRPGRIKYSDDLQVAAIPFADRVVHVSRV